MHSPIQNADMLPATKPERMFSDAPPCLEALVTSCTWRELVLTNTLVNSGINAPATVPQLMMAESTHQRPVGTSVWPSNSNRLAQNVTAMETREVIQTRCVSGASRSKSFK